MDKEERRNLNRPRSRKPGPPKQYESTLIFRVPRKYRECLDQIAAEAGVTYSELLRAMIKSFLRGDLELDERGEVKGEIIIEREERE